MPTIQPFCGWRYDPAKADYALTSMPTYNLVDPIRQQNLYIRNDLNAVRIIAGRDFPEDTGYDNRYTRAASHLRLWLEDSILIQDKNCIYIYEQNFEKYGQQVSRRGFIARVLIADRNIDGIYPHKTVMPVASLDRLKLMKAVQGNTEPVFGLLSDPSGDISRSLYQMCKYHPLSSFTDDSGVNNHLWVMDNHEQAAAFCKGCSQESIYIADGHNRYEAAVNYRNQVREGMINAGQTPPALGGLDSDYVMMYILPDSDPGVFIKPSNKIINNLPPETMSELLTQLRKNFIVEELSGRDKLLWKMGESELPAFGLVIGGKLYYAGLRDKNIMNLRAADRNHSWRELDAAVLDLLIFEDILSIKKPGSGVSVSTTNSTDEAIAGAGSTGCAVLARPCSVDQIRNAARAGVQIPAGNTDFFPDLTSGLVFNLFN